MQKLSLALVSVLALTSVTAEADDIQIAVAGPITGSNAASGEQFKRGAEQAVADINAKGGILGKKLVLTVGDDACDPKQAVAVANQLASKGVVFVDGHYCSVYAEAGVLMITPSASNPTLTDDAFKKKWRNVYRVCGRDDDQGPTAGRYILDHFKGKKVALIDDHSAFGKGVTDQVRKTVNAGGIKEVADESISVGDKDFTALISKLKQSGVEMIYFGGYPTEAGLLVRQAHDQGLNAVLMGGDSTQTDEFWSITGALGEGTLFTFPPDPDKKSASQAVIAEFKNGGYTPEGYTLYSYAAVQVFAEAAEKAKSVKLEDLAKVLHSATFDTVIGPIKYDEKGDITAGGYVVWHWAAGKATEL
jgi:branched-chain amino acid transport system substrate-binding protein